MRGITGRGEIKIQLSRELVECSYHHPTLCDSGILQNFILPSFLQLAVKYLRGICRGTYHILGPEDTMMIFVSSALREFIIQLVT